MNLADIADVVDAVVSLPQWQRRLLLRSSARKLPRLLYKYMAFDPKNADSVRNARALLIESYLWLSRPEDFNDPFDFKGRVVLEQSRVRAAEWAYGVLKDRYQGVPLRSLRRSAEVLASRLLEHPAIGQMSLDHVREQSGVTCFAPSARNALMWAHYAQSHSGICFVFSPERDLEVLGQVQEVNYVKDYPIIKWPSESDRILEKIILCKSDDWRMEAELRIIGWIGGGTQKLPFKPDALRAVICGSRQRIESLKCLAEIIEERDAMGLTPVRISAAYTNTLDYKIRFKRR